MDDLDEVDFDDLEDVDLDDLLLLEVVGDIIESEVLVATSSSTSSFDFALDFFFFFLRLPWTAVGTIAAMMKTIVRVDDNFIMKEDERQRWCVQGDSRRPAGNTIYGNKRRMKAAMKNTPWQ